MKKEGITFTDYFKQTPLDQITEDEYLSLKDSGMMWVFYPESTGIYRNDTKDKV